MLCICWMIFCYILLFNNNQENYNSNNMLWMHTFTLLCYSCFENMLLFERYFTNHRIALHHVTVLHIQYWTQKSATFEWNEWISVDHNNNTLWNPLRNKHSQFNSIMPTLKLSDKVAKSYSRFILILIIVKIFHDQLVWRRVSKCVFPITPSVVFLDEYLHWCILFFIS